MLKKPPGFCSNSTSIWRTVGRLEGISLSMSIVSSAKNPPTNGWSEHSKMQELACKSTTWWIMSSSACVWCRRLASHQRRQCGPKSPKEIFESLTANIQWRRQGNFVKIFFSSMSLRRTSSTQRLSLCGRKIRNISKNSPSSWTQETESRRCTRHGLPTLLWQRETQMAVCIQVVECGLTFHKFHLFNENEQPFINSRPPLPNTLSLSAYAKKIAMPWWTRFHRLTWSPQPQNNLGA